MTLARLHHRRVIVLEAEPQIASHQTGHNSGVIHSGLYYRPESLKARLCVAGRAALLQFCAAHGIRHHICGKLVVATRPEELPALAELHRRGTANRLTGIRPLNAAQLRDFEPHAAGIAGLWVPQTGIVDFRAVAMAFAEVIRQLGGCVRTGSRLIGVVRGASEIILRTTAGEARCRMLINCAGLHADRVAQRCGADPPVRIVPFRGEYYTLAAPRRELVRGLIYPVPDPRFPFLGVHFTRTIDQQVHAGPNAVLALSRHGYRRGQIDSADAFDMLSYRGLWHLARRYWRTGLGELHRSWCQRAFVSALRRLVPDLRPDDLSPGGAGVRAQGLDRDGRLLDDFCILRQPRMLHVLNAPSPAATASLAIAREIAAWAMQPQ